MCATTKMLLWHSKGLNSVVLVFTFVRLTTAPVLPNRPIPTTGPIPTARPIFIRHSHRWAGFSHNSAKNYVSVPHMGRLYVGNCNGTMFSFPNYASRQSRKTSYLGQATTILPHAGAMNRFRATAVASVDPELSLS